MAKKIQAPGNDKPLTKKARVLAMLISAPTSVAMIAKELDISKTAAYSLIGDLKRDGVELTGTLQEGAMHYTAGPARSDPKGASPRNRAFGKKNCDLDVTAPA